MPEVATITLLVHAAVMLFMTGLVWFVQVVHYPLFANVGTARYARYQTGHMRRTRLVVAPPMLVEFGTGIALVWLRPAAVSASWGWLGLVLLAAVWLSTAIVRVPRHDRLVEGWDERAGRELAATNWVRTTAWSARSLLVLAILTMVIDA